MQMAAIQDTSLNRKWSCFGATAWYSMTSACKRGCPNTYAYYGTEYTRTSDIPAAKRLLELTVANLL
jgi:hypothetical protein